MPRARRRRSRRARSCGPQAEASEISSSAMTPAAPAWQPAASPRPSRRGARRRAAAPPRPRAPAPDPARGRGRRRRRLRSAGVLRLVVCGHVRRGDEHGRLPGGRHFPDRPAGACHHEIGRSERRGEVVRPRQEPVVGPQVTANQLLRVALAAQMEHGRPLAPHASTARSFSACAPWLPPKTSTTGPSSGRSNRRRASACETSSTGRTGRPTTRYLDPSRPGTG